MSPHEPGLACSGVVLAIELHIHQVYIVYKLRPLSLDG